MRRLLPCLIALLAALSCNREPIYDERSDYRIEISPVMDMLYCAPAGTPSLYRVCFFDHGTHLLVSTSTVGSHGGSLYNLSPGTYDVVVYDYSFNRTRVTQGKSMEEMRASSTALSFREYPVRESPDHLFVERLDGVVVPHISEKDPQWVLRSTPRSCVDSWCLEITGIRGLENAEGVDIYVTGQSGSLFFARSAGTLAEADCAVWFQGTVDLERQRIRTPFCTFGKLPGVESRLILNMYILGVGGESYVCRSDVTDQFDDPSNTEHVIRAEFDLVIKERRDGGMNPVTTPWDPVIEDVELD